MNPADSLGHRDELSAEPRPLQHKQIDGCHHKFANLGMDSYTHTHTHIHTHVQITDALSKIKRQTTKGEHCLQLIPQRAYVSKSIFFFFLYKFPYYKNREDEQPSGKMSKGYEHSFHSKENTNSFLKI